MICGPIFVPFVGVPVGLILWVGVSWTVGGLVGSVGPFVERASPFRVEDTAYPTVEGLVARGVVPL